MSRICYNGKKQTGSVFSRHAEEHSPVGKAKENSPAHRDSSPRHNASAQNHGERKGRSLPIRRPVTSRPAIRHSHPASLAGEGSRPLLRRDSPHETDLARDRMGLKKEKASRVFVGMSGGVDSSVAAYLLKERGYDVVGIFINGYNVDGCAARDAEDARRAAEAIGIPFYALDLREEYFQYVVKYMIDGYEKGLTPNPDVMCNKEIKFGLFLEKALALGADYIATGHYVRLRPQCSMINDQFSKKQRKKPGNFKNSPKIGNWKLEIAKDLQKDQSYFLWTLTQEQLRHCLFPIGEYTKPEVREIARKAGLPTAEKKDSQGICFLGQVKLPDFLRKFIEPKKGDVLDTEGNKVGGHEGVQFYTIGQRHLNMVQKSNFKMQNGRADKKPLYVVSKDVERNILVVAEGSEHPALFKKEIELTDVHFINPELLRISAQGGPASGGKIQRLKILCRVRYRQPFVGAELIVGSQKSVTRNGGASALPVTGYRLRFTLPVKFVAPGQSAVFYSEGGELLGGGVIKN